MKNASCQFVLLLFPLWISALPKRLQKTTQANRLSVVQLLQETEMSAVDVMCNLTSLLLLSVQRGPKMKKKMKYQSRIKLYIQDTHFLKSIKSYLDI